MDKRRCKVMRVTKRAVIAVTSVLLALYTSGVFDEGTSVLVARHEDESFWDYVLDQYMIPLGQFWITFTYRMYLKFTVINVSVFTMKYLPVALYLYKFVIDVHRSSRERLKIKEIELEDIVLQIAIVTTKQCIREAECEEISSQIESAAARLRAVRARVRDLVASDETLRPLLDSYGPARLANLLDQQATADDFDLMELLKDFKQEKTAIAEKLSESVESEPKELVSVSEKSDYSSLSEIEVEKDCQIKIIKVTNVYKVAYLKHYIKQKRLRRAGRQALLKKKMENIKKLLENWQKALNMVMRDHQYMLEGRGQDEVSEEAGDSRPRDSDTDTPVDEYNPAWENPGPYKEYFTEPDTNECQDEFECQDYNYYGKYYEEIETSVYEELESKYEGRAGCEVGQLPLLLEETSSQLLAVQELNAVDHNDSKEHIIAV